MEIDRRAPVGTEWSAQLDEVSATLERLAEVVGEDDGLDTALDRLVRTATWLIPDADAVSVTVVGTEPEEQPR
jgi:hypothetical protein